MIISTGNGEMEAAVDEIGFHISRITYRQRDILKPSSDGHPTHGGAAHMIPFANRIRNGNFIYNSRFVQLDRDAPPNAIHGLIRNSKFDLKITKNGISGITRIQNDRFPWVYDVEIMISLQKNGFAVQYHVKNLSEDDGPLMIGSHPYFLFSGSWSIHSRSMREMVCKDSYFPTGEFLNPVESLSSAQNRLYDTPFRTDGKIRIDLGNISLKMVTERMPFIIIYTGIFSEGTSVAVEPMTGAIDCFNNGIGLIDLKSGKDFRCSYSVIIDDHN